jgi:hypothetical protein
MALKEAVRTVVETIAPPSAAELRKRLEPARSALVAAQEADSAAQAALDSAYGLDDPKAVLKAESDRAQARLALERAAGRVAALERQLQAAEAAEAADAQAEGKRRLQYHVEARGELGVQILNALDALEGAVKAFGLNEAAILAMPEAIRGRNATPGHLLGSGPLQAHLAVELGQRGILGQPSSVAAPRLHQWLATGSETLGT